MLVRLAAMKEDTGTHPPIACLAPQKNRVFLDWCGGMTDRTTAFLPVEDVHFCSKRIPGTFCANPCQVTSEYGLAQLQQIW